MKFAASLPSRELVTAMARLREPTGTDTPVTAAHVGPVTQEALAGHTNSGVERGCPGTTDPRRGRHPGPTRRVRRRRETPGW
jgi:hypothetical protein